MPIIGLTGGIGSGKSTVAGMLRELGATVIDADVIAREVVEQSGSLRQQLAGEFGHDLLDREGRLRREELGHRVFGHEEKVRRLNELIHPHVFQQLERDIAAAMRAGARAIVIEAALLYETGFDRRMDHVIVVAASEEQRMKRVHRRNGFTTDQIRQRLDSQWPMEEKLRRASVVVWNDGTTDELRLQVRQVYAQWMSDNPT